MEGANLLLVRLQADDELKTRAGAEALAASFVENIPQAIVFTNNEGRILRANPAFLILSQLEDETAARGLAIGNFIGASPGEFSLLLASIKQTSSASAIATSLRGAKGRTLEIDLSATLICEDDDECIGFIVRAALGSAADDRPDVRRPKHPVH